MDSGEMVSGCVSSTVVLSAERSPSLAATGPAGAKSSLMFTGGVRSGSARPCRNRARSARNFPSGCAPRSCSQLAAQPGHASGTRGAPIVGLGGVIAATWIATLDPHAAHSTATATRLVRSKRSRCLLITGAVYPAGAKRSVRLGDRGSGAPKTTGTRRGLVRPSWSRLTAGAPQLRRPNPSSGASTRVVPANGQANFRSHPPLHSPCQYEDQRDRDAFEVG